MHNTGCKKSGGGLDPSGINVLKPDIMEAEVQVQKNL